MRHPRTARANRGLAAVAAAVAAVALLPVLWLVVRGVSEGAPGSAWALLARDGGAVIWRSILLSAGVGGLCVLLTAPAAWLTEATDLPGRGAWRVLLTLPLAVPSYVSGFVVVAAFGPSGWLARSGMDLPAVYGPFGATLALLFAWPYAYLPIRAALSRLDPATWNAARSLGATPLRAFADTVLPVVRPALAGGGLLVALYVLSDFGAVSLTRYRTLSYVVYLRFKSVFGREEAVLYSWWLVGVAALLVFAHSRLAGGSFVASAPAPTRRWSPVRLGRWKWLAVAYCASLATYGVGLPVLVVGYWFWRGVGNGAPIHPFGDAVVNTAMVGAVGGTLVVLAALAPALLPERSRTGRLARGAVNAGFAVPGIVVALSLVFFASRNAIWIYQTLPLLLLAYVVRFVPVASGTLSEHFTRLDPRLGDAARSLGATPARVARSVTLPLLAPALWATFLAAFISVVKELPATLLLAPIEFETLATHIWAQTEEAFFTSVAPPVLVLVTATAAVVALRR